MYTNSPLHLTAPAQHVAEGNMGVKGISVDLQRLCKGIDSAVLATVQKEVQAPVILGWWPRHTAPQGGSVTTPPEIPAHTDRCGQGQQ